LCLSGVRLLDKASRDPKAMSALDAVDGSSTGT
jgi:hypothetical protein